MEKKFSTRMVQPKDLAPVDLHRLLLTAIAPRPIAFASTMDHQGRVNLSPFSYFNIFSTRPPVCIFSPSRRVKDNTEKHTLENVREVPEVCIHMVNFSMTQQMSLASSDFDKGVNEFEKAGFTEVPADLVRPPRVKESPVSLECRVEDVQPLGTEGGSGNLIYCRILRIHLHESCLRVDGTLDPATLDLVGRMGEDIYCRAGTEAMFRIPKPGTPVGLGVDALPEHIRHSDVLSGNDLGKLGHLSALPGAAAVGARRNSVACQEILQKYGTDETALRKALHVEAKGLIEKGLLIDAIEVMLITEENL